MDFSQLNEFLSIFSDSIKIIPKNGKLMAFIALISAALYASFMLLLNYSIKSISLDMFATVKQSLVTPEPPETGFDLDRITRLSNHLRRDFAFLVAVKIVFLLAFSITSFFSVVSTILVSSMSYKAKSLSLKELVSMICGSCRRALITSLYVSALSTGYFVTIAMFASPLWIYPDLPTFWLGVVIMVPSFSLYLYLLVPLILSVVVAVAEESFYGLEALGRAAVLVKGKRLHGFLLNVFYNLVALIIFQCYRIKVGGIALETTSFILVAIVTSLMQIFMLVLYTVFYYQCKMHHDGVPYTKLSMVVLDNDVI